MGEVSAVLVRGTLIAGFVAAFIVEAAESLSCVQCNSLINSCDNNTTSACPQDAQNSCTSALVNSTLGGAIKGYKSKSCSGKACSEKEKVLASFTVYVSSDDHFQFASQCCADERCNTNDIAAPPLEGRPGTKVCPACYGPDEASCAGTSQKCNTEDKCVSLVAKFSNGTVQNTLVLKGCANISEYTCGYLSTQNLVVGGVVFQKFECSDGTNNSSSTSTPTTRTTTTSDTSKVAFTPAALASFLLLGLLL